MEDLSKLPNIGPIAAEQLREIGVESYADLLEMGSVGVALKLRRQNVDVCMSKLYALEGAVRGVRWHDLPKAERAELKKRYEAALKENGL